MKNKLLGALAAVALASVIATPIITAISGAAQVAASDDVRPMLASPLAELRTTSVTCGTSATQITAAGNASMMIINTSATAVYVGGSDVDGSTSGTTGIDVCDGCTVSKKLSVDAKEAYCVVASGSVVVEVLYGVR